MEIQVKQEIQRPPTRRFRPLPNPLTLLANDELILFHSDCGGRVSVDSDDDSDFEAYATVRCNRCFETNREKQSAIARALTQVLVNEDRSNECTVLTFVPTSSGQFLSQSPFASRLQRYLRRGGRNRR